MFDIQQMAVLMQGLIENWYITWVSFVLLNVPWFRQLVAGSIPMPAQSTLGLWGTEWHWGGFFSKYFDYSPVYVMAPLLHINQYPNVNLIRTNGETWELSNIEVLFYLTMPLMHHVPVC